MTLVVTDDDEATGQRTRSLSLVSTPALVSARFSYVCTELTCQFTNESTHQNGVNLLANWDMGDGTPMQLQWSPTHTYAQAGSYEVIMVVLAEDFSGWSSTRQWVTVPVSPPPPPPPPPPVGPTAGFTYSCTWLSCTFSDASTPGSSAITTRSWTFGDGTPPGSGTSVPHTFAAAGTYTVTLSVTDTNGLSNDEAKSVTVQAEPPPPPRP